MKKSNKTVLVTGGAGFIGSHLVDRLIKEGHKVIVVDNLSTSQEENLNPKAKFYKVDIRNSKLSRVFEKEKPDTVFHFAAQISVKESEKDPLNDAGINILGALNVFENCRKYKIKKIIFASSAAIYGDVKIFPAKENCLENPLSPYGIAKLISEKYLNYFYNVYGLPFTALRFANVYGPRQNSKGEAGVIAIFCDKMLSKGKPIIYGSGRQTRDFIFVGDVVEANLLALEKNNVGIFNIGTGKETNINDIFRKLKVLTDSNCQEIHKYIQSTEPKRSRLDYQKAKKEMGWQPRYSLDKGLKETIKWFKNKKFNIIKI
jgi:UDP-glucose 4-epimerase